MQTAASAADDEYAAFEAPSLNVESTAEATSVAREVGVPARELSTVVKEALEVAPLRPFSPEDGWAALTRAWGDATPARVDQVREFVARHPPLRRWLDGGAGNHPGIISALYRYITRSQNTKTELDQLVRSDAYLKGHQPDSPAVRARVREMFAKLHGARAVE